VVPPSRSAQAVAHDTGLARTVRGPGHRIGPRGPPGGRRRPHSLAGLHRPRRVLARARAARGAYLHSAREELLPERAGMGGRARDRRAMRAAPGGQSRRPLPRAHHGFLAGAGPRHIPGVALRSTAEGALAPFVRPDHLRRRKGTLVTTV